MSLLIEKFSETGWSGQVDLLHLHQLRIEMHPAGGKLAVPWVCLGAGQDWRQSRIMLGCRNLYYVHNHILTEILADLFQPTEKYILYIQSNTKDI